MDPSMNDTMHTMNSTGGMHTMNSTGGMHTMNSTGGMHTMNSTGGGHTGGHAGHTGSGMTHPGHIDTEHTMMMYFHEGYKEYILFQDLHTQSKEAMIGACFAVFAVAILYEGLKYTREQLLLVAARNGRSGRYAANGGEDTKYEGGDTPGCASLMCSCSHFVQTVLHMVQVFLSYCLMLVFMTYNVWLCVAVVAGAGVGYFLFGWKRTTSVDSTEHCH